MGGGGNGDSRRNEQINTSHLVFILNPNRRPFLTPKLCGVADSGDCMIGSAFYQDHPQPQAYQPLSAQEYQPLSPHGYQLNSPHEYQLNSPEGYQLNSPQGFHLNSPQGYHLNSSLTTDESISSLEMEEARFPYSTTAQATMSSGYSSSPFPSKDDSGGVNHSSPSSASPQKDDSGDDKHIPLAARRLMNHNNPGEKELLPRRQKRRIE